MRRQRMGSHQQGRTQTASSNWWLLHCVSLLRVAPGCVGGLRPGGTIQGWLLPAAAWQESHSHRSHCGHPPWEPCHPHAVLATRRRRSQPHRKCVGHNEAQLVRAQVLQCNIWHTLACSKWGVEHLRHSPEVVVSYELMPRHVQGVIAADEKMAAYWINANCCGHFNAVESC